jgi:hypothetical protein
MENEDGAPTRYLKVLPEDSITYQETHDLLLALGEQHTFGTPTEITVEKRVGEYQSVPFDVAFHALEQFTRTVRQVLQVEEEDGTSAIKVAEMSSHLIFPYDEYTVTYSSGAQVMCKQSDLVSDDDGVLL